MKISVIIPTWNSFLLKNGSIRFWILSLLKQSYYKNFEIIIIHNWKIEDYEKLLYFVAKFDIKNLKIFRKEWFNRPASRNFWALKSSWKYLLFLDDDIIIYDNTQIEKIYLFFEKNKFDFWFWANRFWTIDWKIWELEKQIILDIENNNFNILLENSNMPTWKERFISTEFSLSRTFIACFWIIKKEVFKKVWMFNEIFDSFDDDLLTYELFKSNFNGISLKNFSVIHINHIINNNYLNYLKNYLDILNKEKFLNYDTIEFLKSLDYKLDNINSINSYKWVHILWEFYWVKKYYDKNFNEVLEYLKNKIKINNLKFLWEFNYIFWENSYTLVIWLAESHLSIHTWPEKNYLTLDIFVCNYENDNTFNAINLLKDIIDFYEPNYFNKKIIYR